MYQVYQEAVQQGFTLWDTAPVYGNGSSEALLGELAADDETIMLSTKFLPTILHTRNALAKSFQKSCHRLKRKQIDIFWIHTANNVEKWTNELIPILEKKQIHMVGVSNHNLDQIKAAKDILDQAGFRLGEVQNHFSLIYKQDEQNGVLDYCLTEGIAYFFLYDFGAGCFNWGLHRTTAFR
ncbi:aldo/keto reductase [Gracilibacillus alcaliphilus]|uniref:aldo/keto reductase n=1 Tax=Gracilibacillus alcaliphilus TaxID=1401441 RepID=UPI00195DB0D3|nr:aryl-alcohol dehydrogenase-like predicted oxidoreductase [Gracilibacillus alcaliphilus]